MRERILLLIALILCPFTLLAAVPGEEKVNRKFERERFLVKHQQYRLKNGLTLIVHEDHNVPIVAVNIWYHVGSRNEVQGKTGFAHLFEHFFFNGSENYPHGFREAMDDLGANNRNGTTNSDRTNFFEDVPVSALERTLYLEADRMGFLAGHISQEMLERERGVVQNEKRQGENQPYGRVFTNVLPRIYPSHHPYSWSTIGSMEDLNAASLTDIKEWYKHYYGPNNAVISLAGDITPERAYELVNKYFGGIPAGPPLTRVDEWMPRFDENLREEMEDRVAQSRIYRIYHVPGWGHRDLQYLKVIQGVLSGSKSARLDRQLIYEKNLVTGISAPVFEKELASNFIIIATLKPGVDAAVVEREIDTIINELIEKGPTKEELQRVQTRTESDFLRGLEKLGGFGGRSDLLAESMTYGGSPTAYLDQLEIMSTATPADVKATARQWLTNHHYTLLVKPYPQLATDKSSLDRKQLPTLGAAPEIKFPGVQRAKLRNGLEIMLLERHSAPIFNAALVVDAGYAADSTEKAGLASMTLDLINEGTRTRDAFKIVNELDSLGANLSANNSRDLSFVHLEGLVNNLAPSFEIFADVVLNPVFPQDLFKIQQQRRLAQITQEKAQPNAMALRVLPPLLYGSGHAYGRPVSGNGYEKTVASLTREDLSAWHTAWFRPNNATLIITGDVTMEKIMPVLEKIFAGWQPGDVPTKQLGQVARSSGKKIYLIDKPDAQQSVIVAAHVSEPGGQADDIAIETVLRNFGGIATSRLNRNLRLDKHWSYGTSGGLMDGRGQRPFVVVAPVQTDKTKESIIEIEKELRGVGGERPLAGEEFASIMRNMTLRLPARFETLSALENAAIEIINYKRPVDYWANYAGNLRGLTEDQLATAAKKFLRPNEVIWVVVGDLKKIEAGIRELGYGEVIHLNADGIPIN